MFRYSGSKTELLPYLRHPPIGTTKIVEPFAGSAKYGLYHRPETLYLYEANTDVHELWRWLIEECTVEFLEDLEDRRPIITKSVRTLGLDRGPETLMRLTNTGMYVGQLSSYVMYGQHSVDFHKIKDALGYVQSRVKISGIDFRDSYVHDEEEGVAFFVDPPYIGTTASYIDKSEKINHDNVLTVEEIADFIAGLQSPIVFTYGTDAPESFPHYNWNVLKKKRVSRIVEGGTKERIEHVAYINFYDRFPDGTVESVF